MTFKRKLVIFSVIFGCFILVIALLGMLAYKTYLAPFFATREQPPPELREAGVLVGADFLAKSEFYEASQSSSLIELVDEDKLKMRLDSIMDVTVGQLDGQPGADVGLVGRAGLTVLDLQGRVKERINYKFAKGDVKVGPLEVERENDNFGEMRVVDVEGDGVCEIFGYDGLDGIALFNHQGQVVFNFGAFQREQSSILEAAAGDIDGDGKLEFVASWGYEPWKGLELFDRFGRSKWRQKEELTLGQLALVDVDGDGKAEIVEGNGSELKIRDARGKVSSVGHMPVSLTYLSLCPRPDGRGAAQNLAVTEGNLVLMDLDGKNFSKVAAPLSKINLEKPRELKVPGSDDPFLFHTEEVYRARGVWVRLRKDQPKYLAVIARFGVIDRSLFYVYDEQAKLVYHEILPEDCNAVVAFSSENEGSEDILVGGEGSVWHYAAR
jgi:hypothetical protein